jgi:LDH2 family malate/lactate/ureidoglycolate dehydrogenase
MTSTASIAADQLEEWAYDVLSANGASAEAAAETAECLVSANRRGLDSHGVLMLTYYLPALRAGATNGEAVPEVVVDQPALALVDGHDGLGAYVMTFASSLCCDKAEQSGAACVAVRNSSHFGAASTFAEHAAERGCAAIILSNSDPCMSPVGALRPVLGTNPIAIAAPAGPDGPVPSLDIATSVVAHGRLTVAALSGERIPIGWAVGPDGNPTDNPNAALAGGVLPMGDHKGFGLSFMIDVLTGCLTGSSVSPDIPNDPLKPTRQGTGHLIVAIHVSSIRELSEYRASLERLVTAVHEAPRNDQTPPFLIPGEREARTATDRGGSIPLGEATVDRLRGLGKTYGATFPL